MNTKFNINNLNNLLDSVEKNRILGKNKHIVSKIDNLMSIFETDINNNIRKIDSITQKINSLVTKDITKEIISDRDSIIYDIKLLLLQNNKIKELVSSAKLKCKKNIYYDHFIENEALITNMINRKYDLIKVIDNIDIITEVVKKPMIEVKTDKLDNYLDKLKKKKQIRLVNHTNNIKLKELIMENQTSIDKLQYHYKINCKKLDNEIINNTNYFSDKLDTDRGKYCSIYKNKLIINEKSKLDSIYHNELTKLLAEKETIKNKYITLEVDLVNEDIEVSEIEVKSEDNTLTNEDIEKIKLEILGIDDNITAIHLENKEYKQLYLTEESKLNNELFINLETYSKVIDKNETKISILNKRLDNIDNPVIPNDIIDKYRIELEYLEYLLEKNNAKFNIIKKRYTTLIINQ